MTPGDEANCYSCKSGDPCLLHPRVSSVVLPIPSGVHTVTPTEVTRAMINEKVEHPSHYGGKDNPFEHVKVAEALGWTENAFIYLTTKYLWRSGGNYVGRKNGAAPLEDLKKARWYLDRLISNLEKKNA